MIGGRSELTIFLLHSRRRIKEVNPGFLGKNSVKLEWRSAHLETWEEASTASTQVRKLDSGGRCLRSGGVCVNSGEGCGILNKIKHRPPATSSYFLQHPRTDIFQSTHAARSWPCREDLGYFSTATAPQVKNMDERSLFPSSDTGVSALIENQKPRKFGLSTKWGDSVELNLGTDTDQHSLKWRVTPVKKMNLNRRVAQTRLRKQWSCYQAASIKRCTVQNVHSAKRGPKMQYTVIGARLGNSRDPDIGEIVIKRPGSQLWSSGILVDLRQVVLIV
ncbi:hypothetical protein B0H19DRAFT_1082025 [Mycena capillaripes]|nr:hypothetical protein B0H19DRAFT_1082025 [Mycena capillaripes]